MASVKVKLNEDYKGGIPSIGRNIIYAGKVFEIDVSDSQLAREVEHYKKRGAIVIINTAQDGVKNGTEKEASLRPKINQPGTSNTDSTATEPLAKTSELADTSNVTQEQVTEPPAPPQEPAPASPKPPAPPAAVTSKNSKANGVKK